MRLYYVLMIVLMGAVTYASRVGLIGVARQVKLHPLLERSLEYVPVAILSALLFPALFAPSGHLESPVNNAYIWAAAATLILLWLTKRQWLAIVLGVASLVLLRRFVGA
jgi:branched-subunit amino acid transport protein